MSSTQTVTVLLPEATFGSPVFPRLNSSNPSPPDEEADNRVRPDIEWMPLFQTYIDRVERLKHRRQNRPTAVPSGWPTELKAPRVWDGSDFKDPANYVIIFTENDIKEVEAGLEHFKGMSMNAFHHTGSSTSTPSSSALTIWHSLAKQ
jgi:hypothetical protein